MSHVFSRKHDSDSSPNMLYVFHVLMKSYLESIKIQLLYNDPYVKDLSKIIEPNFLLVKMEDGSMGLFHIR